MLLNEMEIFYHVVEQQSFSKAAERLSVSKSFISKRMTKLEQALQVRLISRSTRKLILTEAGKSFYQYCVDVVQDGEDAYAMINELQGQPSGRLKISIPPAMALSLLAPVFAKYLAKYPAIELDICLESRLVDLVKEGYDLVLRSAQVDSTNLIAQRIFTFTNVVCATQAYLDNHAQLMMPSDLTQHNCALYSGAKSLGQVDFSKQKQKEMVYLKGNVKSNDLQLVKQLVLSDICIGFLPEFMVINELNTKKLVRCLDTYVLTTNNIFAIYLDRRFRLPKLQVFLGMLKGHLAIPLANEDARIRL